MSKYTYSINGFTKIYAIMGDPICQIQTPRLINPIFASTGTNIFAVPFRVMPHCFLATWDAFAAIPNLAGIGVTIPYKLWAAQKCTTLSPTAKAVGAVNSIQRGDDGRMHGALFDGTGFICGMGNSRHTLPHARVLMVGTGGSGRAIAYALANEGVQSLTLMDIAPESVTFTIDMVNAASGREIARSACDHDGWDYDVVINASPIGLSENDKFPMPANAIRPSMLIADIASLGHETALLQAARSVGARTFDGNAMLKAQIALIAGFAAGFPAGTQLQTVRNHKPR